MDGLKMLFTRRSVRNFKSKSIDSEIIQKIVRAGKLAATAREDVFREKELRHGDYKIY